MHTYICIHMHACMYMYVYEREMAAYESRLCCSSAIYVVLLEAQDNGCLQRCRADLHTLAVV